MKDLFSGRSNQKQWIPILLLVFICGSSNTQAQFFRNLFGKPKEQPKEKVNETDSTKSNKKQYNFDFSVLEADGGIREALIKGVTQTVETVSMENGFFGNELIKIPFPQEVNQVESALRKVGMGKMVDDAVQSMNRAAEDASKEAAIIFVDAIKELTIEDAFQLIAGSDDAATQYLKGKTSLRLEEKFKPIIEASLSKVNATKYWDDVVLKYNQLPFVKKVNPDLTEYVNHKAIEGLFIMVAKEEEKIRKDPAERTKDILDKVFGSLGRN